jgi:hypothetical protein
MNSQPIELLDEDVVVVSVEGSGHRADERKILNHFAGDPHLDADLRVGNSPRRGFACVNDAAFDRHVRRCDSLENAAVICGCRAHGLGVVPKRIIADLTARHGVLGDHHRADHSGVNVDDVVIGIHGDVVCDCPHMHVPVQVFPFEGHSRGYSVCRALVRASNVHLILRGQRQT